MGASCSDNRTDVQRQIDEFLALLRSAPKFNQYQGNQESAAHTTKGWGSSVFGGSVLNPVGSLKKKRSRPNQLEKNIKAMNINPLYGGGFYVLKGVQQYSGDKVRFLDIWILVADIAKPEVLKVLKEKHEEYLATSHPSNKMTKAVAKTSTKTLVFEEIQDYLTGYARIITYKVNDMGAKEIISLEEGHFANGLKAGYCRGISGADGSCAVGFHIEGRPQGKWSMYKSNGEFALP